MGPETSVVVGSELMVIISAVQNSVISNDGAEYSSFILFSPFFLSPVSCGGFSVSHHSLR